MPKITNSMIKDKGEVLIEKIRPIAQKNPERECG